MKIRPASPEDHAALLDIWLRSVRATHAFLAEEDIQFLRRGGGRMLVEHARERKGPLLVDANEQNPEARAFNELLRFTAYSRTEVDGTGRPFPIIHCLNLGMIGNPTRKRGTARIPRSRVGLPFPETL